MPHEPIPILGGVPERPNIRLRVHGYLRTSIMFLAARQYKEIVNDVQYYLHLT